MGNWDGHYSVATELTPYGPDDGYRAAAEWVEGMHVEDWGCGLGWLRHFIEPDLYRGVDGSASPFADEVVDLRMYQSQAEAIVMRGVLEHNGAWADILHNACRSFDRRLAVVLFTPLVERTHLLRIEPEYDVPTYAFKLADLVDVLNEHMVFNWHVRVVLTPGTEYGYETLLGVER